MNFNVLWLLQENTTPDTSPYMLAGYAIIFSIMILYPISLYVRSRKLQQDLMLLEAIEKETL